MENNKITRLPIGMDYHTMFDRKMEWGPQMTPIGQELNIEQLRQTMKPFYERQIKCYSNYHFHLERGDRKECFTNVPKELVYFENNLVERNISHKKQLEYAFVLSPFGCGYDCHRTWEALVLGCIPIIKHSGLDKLFDELPVLLIDKWSDVTEERLIITVEKYKNTVWNYNKLTQSYWINLIKSYSSCIQ